MTTTVGETAGQLEAIRTGFGNTLTSLSVTGEYHAEAGWWLGLTGAPEPDFNLALVHGGRPRDHAAEAIDRIGRARVPSLVMLAGRGLEAAQVLVDSGWVCTGAMALMGRGEPADFATDPDVRELGPDDMPAAREVAAGAFGVRTETVERIYAEPSRALPGRRVLGMFHEGALAACVVLAGHGDVGTMWSLAARSDLRNKGYGERLLLSSITPGVRVTTGLLCGLAAPRAIPLYLRAGATPIEHWQTWSRPRWMLGA